MNSPSHSLFYIHFQHLHSYLEEADEYIFHLLWNFISHKTALHELQSLIRNTVPHPLNNERINVNFSLYFMSRNISPTLWRRGDFFWQIKCASKKPSFMNYTFKLYKNWPLSVQIPILLLRKKKRTIFLSIDSK